MVFQSGYIIQATLLKALITTDTHPLKSVIIQPLD